MQSKFVNEFIFGKFGCWVSLALCIISVFFVDSIFFFQVKVTKFQTAEVLQIFTQSAFVELCLDVMEMFHDFH